MAAYYERTHENDKTYFLQMLAEKELCCKSHFHSNIEIVYVLSGSATATINGIKYELKENYTCLILNYEEHEFIVEDNCNCINLIVPEFMIRSFLATTYKKSFSSSVMLPNEDTALFENCLRRLLLPLHPLAAKGFIYVILGHMLSTIPLTENKIGSHEHKNIMNALNYIDSNYLNNITLSEVSNHIGYSESSFSTLFNEVVGCGFREYLNSLRINHANYLFSQGQRNVLNVAIDSGFNSVRTFNRAYKSKMGMPPKDYINGKLKQISKVSIGDHITIANMKVFSKDPLNNNAEQVLWHWTNRSPSTGNVSNEVVDVDEAITGVSCGVKTTFLNALSYDVCYYQDKNYEKPIDLTDIFENTYLSFYIKSSDNLDNISFKIFCGNKTWISFMSSIFTVNGAGKWQKITIKLSEMSGAAAFDKENFIFTWLQPAEIPVSTSLKIK